METPSFLTSPQCTKLILSVIIHISIDGNSILPVAQAKTVTSSLTPLFLSHCTSSLSRNPAGSISSIYIHIFTTAHHLCWYHPKPYQHQIFLRILHLPPRYLPASKLSPPLSWSHFMSHMILYFYLLQCGCPAVQHSDPALDNSYFHTIFHRVLSQEI